MASNCQHVKFNRMFRLLAAAFILSGNLVHSQQNLVPNGDFESYWDCPYQQNDSPLRCTNWYQASEASSDYLNACSDPQINGCTVLCATVPENTSGFQVPHSGDGYCGFVAYSMGTPLEMQYKEYIGLKLPQPLEAGAYYVLRFFVSLGDSCLYATDQIGCHLSQDSLIIPDQGPSFITPLISNNNGVIADKENWTEITNTFQAVGNERYITIGSFKGYSDMTITEFPLTITNINQLTAYYFVDDVTLHKIEHEPETSVNDNSFPNILTPNGDNTNESIDFSLLVTNLISFEIINRWGTMVYQGTTKENCVWNGIDLRSGKICSDGVYFYSINYSDNGKEKQKHGFIQLIK